MSAETNDADARTVTAEIYHTRFLGDRSEVSELCRDIRCGMVDAEEIDLKTFSRCYEYAGEVEVELSDCLNTWEAAWSAWEAGEGHNPSETRSMATGDIVAYKTNDETEWAGMAVSIGFETLPLLSSL